jgi:flagellar basal-body rod protein FlgG
VALGKLDLVKFPEKTLLDKADKGYFTPNAANAQTMAAENIVVQQGALEEANFNPVEEMAQMVDTQRVYESYQKALQMFQQEDSQLISKLGGQ